MSNESDAEKRSLDQRFRLMYEACEQAGINAPLTMDDVIRRFKALERGLPAEDEFAVLAGWLGKCRLIHKLNQEQSPLSSKELYQVPDLFAVFDHKDRKIPTLIEVKKTKDTFFKWSKGYYGKLRAYADLLNLPLLIAWKFRPDEGVWAIWTLFDTRLFDSPNSSYKVTLERASSESLLGQLAGDFRIDVKAGVGLHLRLDLIGDKEDWKRMKEANNFFGQMRLFWTNGSGKGIDKAQMSPALLAILNCIPPLSDSSLYEGESYRIYSFALRDNHPIFAHQMLPLLLTDIPTLADNSIRWREVLSRGDLPISIKDVYEAAGEAADNEIVEFVLYPIPETTPTFL